ncbi:MAG: hypothetical protein H7301_08290 [Cryobacterium sp.]|nr:hypothetical protein [Oligoflexia bacterium]
MTVHSRPGVWVRSVFFISVLITLSAFAEPGDISVQGAQRPSNIRVQPRVRPSAAPAQPVSRVPMPRPIQDETTQVPVAPQAVAPRDSFQNNAVPSVPARVAVPTARQPVPAAPARASRGAEQAVDLDALTASPSARSAPSVQRGSTPTRGTSVSGMSPHGVQPGGTIPNFKFYYDFLLKSWKGGGANVGSLSFDNYHQKMLVEYTPNQDFTFSASIIGLDYYEVDYLVSPKIQLRWGKIWIPFDDMSPHNIFGGRVNTSRLLQVSTTGTTEQSFLPDIWADLGVAAKWTLAESASFNSVLHFYVVNGFSEGGTSPVAGESAAGVKYPNFAAAGGGPDNNNNKAMGTRWAFGFGPRFGMGLSYYTGTYTGNTVPEGKALTIFGGDIQIRPTNTTEIRMGLTSMKVGLSAPATKDSFTRGGSYVELGQRFGQDNRWKFLVRAGKSQNDNRVVDVSDKSLIGMTLLKNFRVFEAQATVYKDLNKVDGKTGYNYAALRLVTAF